MATTDAPPRITPYLLRMADAMCPRRLRSIYQGLKGDDGAFLRGRVRDALVEDARAAHAEMRPPEASSFFVREELLPEERLVYRKAADGYLELFADEPVVAADHEPFDRPLEWREFRLGGWIDLAVERPSGVKELRQFELWGGPLRPDPFDPDATAILCAVLRLAKWAGNGTLVVRHVDPVGRRIEEQELEMARDLPELKTRFYQRLSILKLRASVQRPTPVPGQECAGCAFVAGCEALR